jgi:hypothetical protein
MQKWIKSGKTYLTALALKMPLKALNGFAKHE